MFGARPVWVWLYFIYGRTKGTSLILPFPVVFCIYVTVKDFLKKFKEKYKKYMLTNNIICHII